MIARKLLEMLVGQHVPRPAIVADMCSAVFRVKVVVVLGYEFVIRRCNTAALDYFRRKGCKVETRVSFGDSINKQGVARCTIFGCSWFVHALTRSAFSSFAFPENYNPRRIEKYV